LEVARDLGQLEPWQESLERSRARRNQPDRARTRRPRRARRLVAGLAGVLALAALAVALPTLFGGHGAQPSLAAVQPLPLRPGPAPRDGDLAAKAAASAGALRRDPRTCPLIVQATDYVNPLRGAKVMPERIDQGVDYAGRGTLSAIGAGRVTYLSMSETGWPGAFIEYRLSSGPDAGCYVYYAEGVTPARHLRVGQTVSAGQAIATIIPEYSSGIEIGWGAGINTKTLAAKLGQWDYTRDADSVPSRTGRNFSALIDALGGPPGKAEG
jgi:murein DD-endopeptidase MepM/ murein hydrolase activator NlpD